MKIIEFPNQQPYSNKPKIFALGKFEGFHLAHKHIFKTARKIADEKGYELGIMLYTERDSENLFSLEERIMFAKKFKPDYIMLFKPSKENFMFSKDDFEKWMLDINIKELSIGDDFTYGTNKLGKAVDLNKKFIANISSEISIEGDRVSTTSVVNSIKNSDFKKYLKFYNHYFFYHGEIVKGLGNGKKFNMPTANVKYEKNKISIPDGIYFSYAIINGKRLPSLTSISFNPTLNGKQKTYETYIYNFEKNIYGQDMYVELIEKYRDTIKFNSISELIAELENDKKIGKDFFSRKKKVK